jgi:N6-L-threonylcarbamoyladenine synthase
LPIAKTKVEAASFDMQKIKNPGASGKDCQQDDQLGFWNVREYVLFRDGYVRDGRKNCKNPILNVRRIESRKIGGGAPNNPAALCEDCHSGYRDAHGHRGAAFGITRVS